MTSSPVEDLAQLLSTVSRPLFVIGSAISYSAPAEAPSAYEVMSARLHGLAERGGLVPPALSPALSAELTNPTWEILPESLYSAVAEAYPPGIHEAVWGTLSVAGGIGLCPNLGHLLVALVASRSGGLILTTNFDHFLEMAIRELGAEPEVVTGYDLWSDPSLKLGYNGITLLKIHGDAGKRSSIVSKAPDRASAPSGASFWPLHYGDLDRI